MNDVYLGKVTKKVQKALGLELKDYDHVYLLEEDANKIVMSHPRSYLLYVHSAKKLILRPSSVAIEKEKLFFASLFAFEGKLYPLAVELESNGNYYLKHFYLLDEQKKIPGRNLHWVNVD